jgi:hypothetical protein
VPVGPGGGVGLLAYRHDEHVSAPEVSIRELRNHAGDVVDRVAAGQRLTVTGQAGPPLRSTRWVDRR